MTGEHARELFLKTFGRPPAQPGKPGAATRKGKSSEAADDEADDHDETDMPDGETQQPTAAATETVPAKPADRIIYHVMLRKNDNRWSVLKQGRAKPNRVLETQAEAIEFAMTLARTEGEAWVITHSEDGAIAEEIHVKPQA